MKNNNQTSAGMLAELLHSESSGGLIMIFTTVLALFAANGATAEWYNGFIHYSMGGTSLSEWVKDVLMVFFFLLVGMELKREMLEGFLVDKKQVLLPLFAAVGGMVAPAIVYLIINRGLPAYTNGWAIPSATDIAFALCILMLAGKKIPPSLKIFLLAIAIFDDLGAILIIAFFYSGPMQLVPFLTVAAGCAVLWALNKLRVMSLLAYLATGVGLWFALHASGIHTTIGGVLVGMAIPMRDSEEPSYSPLTQAMDLLHPWVNFLILPLFAFTAAGISLAGELTITPLVLGIAGGLFIGKQIGIFGITFLLVKLGIAKLPDGTGWRHIYGVSLLAGIGFTMSLFIGQLAFSSAEFQEEVKLGVLLGSIVSAFFGWLILRTSRPLEI